MKFIDSHIHLQDFTENNTTDIINQAEKAGVEKFICIYTYEKVWQKADEFDEKFPNKIIPAFGLYPGSATEADQDWLERLEKQLHKYPNAMIGEIGLDSRREAQYEPQATVFLKQIELAKRLKRPILIHAVKVDQWLENFWDKMPERFVFHSFNGRAELLRKVIKHGGYVSFSFSILGNRDKERVLREAPADRILIETDGPYQSMIPNTENVPSRLPFLAEEIARIRNEKVEDFAAQVYQNTEKFING